MNYLKSAVSWALLITSPGIAGCRQGSENSDITVNRPDTVAVTPVKANPLQDFFRLSPVSGEKLVPLAIVDSFSHNIFEKYGLDAGGVCYECNRAGITISERELTLVNVCDSQQRASYKISAIKVAGNRLSVHCTAGIFTFDKENDGPVYHLNLEVEKEPGEKLRLNRHFTTEPSLPKFGIHDCGDFQG